MISDFEAKENTNAFPGIMLPTVCNSRKIQQYEVTFFTLLTAKDHLQLLNVRFTHSKASHGWFLWKALLGCINQIKAVVRMLTDSSNSSQGIREDHCVQLLRWQGATPWDPSCREICQPHLTLAGDHLGHTQSAFSRHKHLTVSLPSQFSFLLRKHFKQHSEVKGRAGEAGPSLRE